MLRTLFCVMMLSHLCVTAVDADSVIGITGQPGYPTYVGTENGNIYIEWTLRANVFASAGVPPGRLVGLAFGCTNLWAVDSDGETYSSDDLTMQRIDNVFTSANQIRGDRSIQLMCDVDCVMYAVTNMGEVFARTMRSYEGQWRWQYVGSVLLEQPTGATATTWGRLKNAYGPENRDGQ